MDVELKLIQRNTLNVVLEVIIHGTYLRYSEESKKVCYLDGCDRACCTNDSTDNFSHCSFIAVVLSAVYIAYRSWNINQDMLKLIL